ncbi:MAG: type III-A CRISPR-associated RAMP protein Csm4 [Methanobacteriaceae archaeon]
MLVYLEPLSIFPELHSDTLFGAICYAISELFPEKIDDIINEFRSSPPFLTSSAFPFAFNENNKIRFFPKIIFNQYSEENSYDVSNFKKYKKVEFIEEDIFFNLISGKLKESEIINNLENYNITNGFLVAKELDLKININSNIIPNNSINRITNETEGIFYSEGNEFSNSGLFFIIKFNNKEYEKIVESAIMFLKDRGFGKDISTGKGHFDFEIVDYDLPEIKGDYFLTLSRFIPSKEDLKKINKFSYYEIGSKRGRSSSGEIRKEVKFFKEGSVFPHYNKFYGTIIDSGKIQKAVEYGFAFPLKCNFGSD